MISYSGSHGRGPVSVFFVVASHLLSQTEMRLDEVIIGEGEMELLLQALTLLGKGDRLSDQASAMMPHRQVVALDKAGVNVAAHGRVLELGGNCFLATEDEARTDLDHPPVFATLDYLSVE